MRTPNPEIPNIPNTAAVATQLSFGAVRPVVLFPVRLETRFFKLADGNSELRVRVYPDTVHIDSHEAPLTPEEVTWGQHFWEQTWRAAEDKERAKAAWSQLAERFDPPRAAWIAQQLKPLNPDDRPKQTIAPTDALPKKIRFPTPPTQPESWMRAPLTRVLPNFWVLLGYKNGNLVVNVKGGAIREALATGPDPQSVVVDETGLDKGMKWMVDFAEAEEAGMGIRVKLTPDVAAAGFDFLLVLGIRDSETGTTDWSSQLSELFAAHHYTSGISFIAPGTPSNNTADAPSGFTSTDPGQELSYSAERETPVIKPGDGSNADRLTSALGLTASTDTFAKFPHAAATDQLDAGPMNTALWQATWGYFLSQMLGKQSPLNEDDVAWMRRHFIDYVRANGPLPALRIGKQPYGILPVTSLGNWKPPQGQESQFSRDVALRDFLLSLRNVWNRSVQHVPRLGRSDDVDPQSGFDTDLAEVLSMEGVSSSYSLRHFMGRNYLEHLWVFLSADFFLNVWNQAEPEPPPREEPPKFPRLPAGMPREERLEALREQRAELAEFENRQKELQREFQRAVRAQQLALESRQRSQEEWWAERDRLATAALRTLGVTWRPRLANGVFAPLVTALNGPLVQADHGLALSPNYIDALLAARDLIKEVRFRNLSTEQPPPHTLLHLLLRHSMLLEYTSAASRLLVEKKLIEPALLREPELVDLPVGQLMRSIWRQMAMKITVEGQAEPMEVSKYLLGFLPTGEPDTARVPGLKQISEFRASLAHLKSLNVNKLETLMAGTLDISSHRLDAWITSIATKRLVEMRQKDPKGILFGGYGWVMNLTPAPAQTKMAVPPAGEPDPVFEQANNPGFVHTPSLAQASTAAILRSGHLAHAGAAKQMPNDLLAIDLSSERVRLAIWLLDGVRQGQPLGALLGYRFERRLQEAKIPEFIAPLRELVPLVARKFEQPNQPVAVEAIAANNVVDGLGLLRRWQKGKSTQPEVWNDTTIPFGRVVGEQKTKLPPPNLNDPKFKQLTAELNVLEEAVDSVSDALVAEGVYQIVRGNPLRAASTVESIAGGEAPPPELEVVRTPRTGVAFTHRVLTLVSGPPAIPAGWGPPAHQFRADAEPHLNAWLAKLLGSPANVRCVVERLDPETKEVLNQKELRLDELKLAPLDFVYALEGGQGGQQAEIEQRILYRAVKMDGGFGPGSLLRINPARKPEWKLDELSYGEFSELLRTARKLLNGARYVNDGDLNPPERSTDFSMDLAELEARATNAAKALTDTATDFNEGLATPANANLETLRDLIIRAGAFGVAGAVPLSAAGDSADERATLLTQANSIHKELGQRADQLQKLANSFNREQAGDEQRRDHSLAQLRLVFGKSFLVLPRFTATNRQELKRALANTKLLETDPLAATTWFQRVARVRDGVAGLNAALTYTEALNTGEKLNLKIAQLPHDEKDRWVGLPLKPGASLPGGKLSLAVQTEDTFNVDQPLAGLFIDEWVEVVPGTSEITGLALQFDQPSAAPPQTILLAVPPDLEASWTIWSLQQVLLETLDLARIRAVDAQTLAEVNHYLPASYFAFNAAGDTVSTDFTTIKKQL